MPLVECVPNFSEGRRPEVIAAIVAAASRSAHVLDVSSDIYHNRTVVTFAGEPEPVVEAAFQTIKTAAELIDLDIHRGVHPRIGAADVVPLVPLRGISLTDCTLLAHGLGEKVGRELGLPVYLYEAAARQPERRNLADVRRGGYELLRAQIDLPERAPDFGPARVRGAGAVIIGAREPLIAFNAYLDTADVKVAKAVARAIRESNGGVPYLKAIGVLAGDEAQVSMNVIDFRRTSLFQIMRRLREEVARHGSRIVRTELIGLIPQAALLDYALESLQLPTNPDRPILELRLGAATGDFRPILFE